VSWLPPLLYRLGWFGTRFTFVCTMNLRVIRLEIANRPGPYVLACSHLSNLEPFLIGTAMRRKIDFMARVEFYQYRVLAWGLYALDAFKVIRQGVPVSAIRTALDRLRRGRIVGIFPEGGVSRGRSSVCLGGPIKLGAAMIACRANVPVVPCVVLGTHELNRVGPWLPFKRAHAWMAFGEPIPPIDPGTTHASRKAAYAEVGRRIQAGMAALYAELCQTYGLTEMAGETFAEAATASMPHDRKGSAAAVAPAPAAESSR
jgi:1-acyl-sn-glycerol-3-phosphate acyltransferase